MDFNIFVGTETGILKGVNVNQKAVIQKSLIKPKLVSRENEITAMTWGDENEEEVLYGLRDQTVAVYDVTCNSIASKRQTICGTGPIVSLFRWNESIVTGVKSGHISIWKGFDKQAEINTLPNEKDDSEKTLARVRKNPVQGNNTIVSGGKENPVKIWDLEKPEVPTFTSKNVRPDFLELRIKDWPSDVAFMNDGTTIASCTRYKHVRLYDPRAQRRPVVTFEWEHSPFTCLATIPSKQGEIVVGTSHGKIAKFDLRGNKPELPICIFKGFAGAVRSIHTHPTLPIICSVSLDRFMRIHNLTNHKLIHKEYMKSRLNAVLVRSSFSVEHLPTAAANYNYKRRLYKNKVQEDTNKRIKI